MWGIHVTAVNHVMQPGQVSSRDNFLLLLWLYSISWCCAGMSTTEFFHQLFHSTVLTGNRSPWRPKFTSMQCGCKFAWELWWSQMNAANKYKWSRAFFAGFCYISEISASKWSDLISRWIERDRMMTGEDQAAAAAASTCSLCRRFCERNSIWWMWNNIWKFVICTLVLVNCVMSKLTQGT